ncbi:MAG: thioredoxin domain-containing protein, partial [Flavobacteriales bacterium]|nr:thioredoxin domain-containing protein [Flavobacteriales bacterium]
MARHQSNHPANRLAQERSPYLLQHAHNPVDWHPWGEAAFAKARAENKLVLVSIGYSSCHWCHVMERESFMDTTIAGKMNAHYVCIKVDREERPDVDHVYMTAVQLMTRSGGWPLNCFALPDGRPIYGGTYFPPAQWAVVLDSLQATWANDPARVQEQGERLAQGVAAAQLVDLPPEAEPFSRRTLERLVDAWSPRFDPVHGGDAGAPKFAMPNGLEFLLAYGTLAQRPDLPDHVRLTLRKMAQGGIFDQVGGGFARYSVDERWKVPHFEKMLYDNAQLISLYSRAHQVFGDPLHRRTVERTIAFVQRELTAADGTFHSALDADTAGEEGRYYVWTKDEMMEALGPEHDLAAAYYGLDERGHWEHGRHVLQRPESDGAFAAGFGIAEDELEARITAIDQALLRARERRERPGLDHKVLTAWNALMVSALCHAHDAFGRPEWLAMARRCMDRLLATGSRPDGGLWRVHTDGHAAVNGYLDDLAFAITALLDLYGATFNEAYITRAQALAEHAITHYHDPATGLFHFTSDKDPALVARPIELHDNVVPASNSAMAHALFRLGMLLDQARYGDRADAMLAAVQHRMAAHPTAWTNWARLL